VPAAPASPDDTDETNTADDTAVRREARRFGVDQLRPWQDEAVRAATGGRDVVVLAPTGSGKSLVYQLAGVLRGGWTLVVSPLLSLQADQVDHLEQASGVRAARLSSAEPAGRREELLGAVAEGGLDFLFLSPEQLARPELRERLAARPPSLVAIDEAHCVSEWGHDFRPDYLRLGELLDELEQRPVRVALTATAAPPVLASLADRLTLDDPLLLVADLERPGLHLAVEHVPDADLRDERVLDAVASYGDVAGLVYARTRRAAEELAAALEQRGHRAEAYHAGLGARRRTELQSAFMAGEVPVLVATSAFGMGIDKPDVRFVVHAQAPGSVDAYFQEVGRAGRDGEPAQALLLYRPEDLGLARFFAGGVPRRSSVAAVLAAVERTGSREPEQVAPVAELGRAATTRVLNLLDLTDDPAHADVDAVRERAEAHRSLERSRVEMVRAYAESDRCRSAWLSGYFGQQADPCGHCDACDADPAVVPERHEESVHATVTELEVETVTHPEFGSGTVVDHEDDRITVLFADAGYKTLARSIVEERHLLEG
jgi:ATP-dependent DNA helicase RecQ